jgi:GNAT superfamily N-acetyltransferase
MKIRDMSAADLDSVAALCRQLASEDRSADALAVRVERARADPRHSFSVAVDDDGRVVAWMHLHETYLVASDPCLQVLALVVDEACRGRGVGKLMMEFAERRAASRGLPRLYLHSQVKRTDAHRFYEGLGYSKLKTQIAFEKRLR